MESTAALAVVFVGGLLLLLLSGIYIGIAFVLLATVLLLITRGPSALDYVGGIAWSTVTSDIFITVPLFILMGELLFAGGLGSDLFDTTSKWLGGLPAGLGVASLGACTLFGSVCGSSVVTAATIGTVAYPEMRKRGYSKEFSCGLLALGGGIGILIPPSIPFIVYAMLTEESVGKMFMAGVIPGLLLALVPGIYAVVFAWRYPERAPRSAPTSWRDRFKSLGRLWGVALLIVAVLLTMYLGISTPSEAGAIGVLFSLPVIWLHKRISIQQVWVAFERSINTVAMITLIIIGASILNHAIAWAGIPEAAMRLIVYSGWLPSWSIVPAVCAAFLVLGMFMESLAVMLLILPAIMPAMRALGIDTIWLGVIMVMNIEIGLLTPPVALNLFVIQSVSGEPFGTVARGVWPFVALSAVVLILIILFPPLATWLPSTMKR